MLEVQPIFSGQVDMTLAMPEAQAFRNLFSNFSSERTYWDYKHKMKLKHWGLLHTQVHSSPSDFFLKEVIQVLKQVNSSIPHFEISVQVSSFKPKGIENMHTQGIQFVM